MKQVYGSIGLEPINVSTRYVCVDMCVTGLLPIIWILLSSLGQFKLFIYCGDATENRVMPSKAQMNWAIYLKSDSRKTTAFKRLSVDWYWR